MRRLLILSALTLLLGVSCLLSLFLGSRPNGVAEVVAVLSGTGDPYLAQVVDSRIPRTIIGMVVGGALALSGTLIQGITRNPLGEPGLLGISTGGAAALVTATALLGVLSGPATILFALLGALLAVSVVLALAGRSGSRGVVPLILAGAVVTAVLHAYINAMILLQPQTFDSYRYWMVGSLSGADLGNLGQLAPVLVLGLILAFGAARGLNALALGEETAISLGIRVGATRLAGVMAAALLAAAATAAAGPIAFIGLAVPHLLRALFGEDFRWRIPAALIGGALALVLADILARTLIRPQELMVGILTAFLGAPFLLLAVRRGAVMR
ncbi:Ferric enterobactin transport system permease protein FepD [Corynebacterium occultum]|uniref:Ferric enterobactin transport system permease protein FepD n=1 Tax=Corynebacterium occultum TaxID=2675219 RepID=A0A6B8W948_9CORY|nr:iron ABC transporter permease [Corynebacterium occultum]QGU06530.1 Ferric enterobactin transport system permease protein FepD [Corynebacterium occultum]